MMSIDAAAVTDEASYAAAAPLTIDLNSFARPGSSMLSDHASRDRHSERGQTTLCEYNCNEICNVCEVQHPLHSFNNNSARTGY